MMYDVAWNTTGRPVQRLYCKLYIPYCNTLLDIPYWIRPGCNLQQICRTISAADADVAAATPHTKRSRALKMRMEIMNCIITHWLGSTRNGSPIQRDVSVEGSNSFGSVLFSR
nr:hypothetical protein CFP56_03805 [Quercus suber]